MNMIISIDDIQAPSDIINACFCLFIGVLNTKYWMFHVKLIKYNTDFFSFTKATAEAIALSHCFPELFTTLWPHCAAVVKVGWIIFSRRFIMRSCICMHWTCRRFCWCMARRTSLHMSSMARLDLFCCCSMACISRSFFLFIDSRLLASPFLDELGWELGNERRIF